MAADFERDEEETEDFEGTEDFEETEEIGEASSKPSCHSYVWLFADWIAQVVKCPTAACSDPNCLLWHQCRGYKCKHIHSGTWLPPEDVDRTPNKGKVCCNENRELLKPHCARKAKEVSARHVHKCSMSCGGRSLKQAGQWSGPRASRTSQMQV